LGLKREKQKTNVKKAASGLSVILLAAGTSSRFPGTKQLAKVGGKTLLGRALDSVPASDIKETVVVVGHDAPSVTRAVGTRRGVTVVPNPDYRDGMATSIKTGLSAVGTRSKAVMIVLADQPFITRQFLRGMLDAFEAHGSSGIVAAARGGVIAPPAIFSRRYFAELSGLRGDQGAKSVIERHMDSVRLIRVRSSHRLRDVDTRQDLEAARRLLEA
jgi:molybdenum cofactor cytidylyltransferase